MISTNLLSGDKPAIRNSRYQRQRGKPAVKGQHEQYCNTFRNAVPDLGIDRHSKMQLYGLRVSHSPLLLRRSIIHFE